MLSRRLVGAAPRSGLRCLSTTASRGGRTPCMGDISPTPQSIEQFNQRQKEFREKLAEARKKRDAGALKQGGTAAAAAPQETEQKIQGLRTQGLGSLSTASTDKAAELAEHEPRKSGRLTNLIYGTKEGREMDAQIEASFSAVLARGKYVHSIVFHQVKPDKVDEYVKLTGEWYPKMASKENNNLHLVGSFRTEVGDCDTFGMFARVATVVLAAC